MDGFLNLLKPPGMTSHDVVGFARRTLQIKAIGHTGTLDPVAAGVMILTVGKYTRLGEYLTEGDKAYRAEVTLGLTTDCADVEGPIIAEASAAHVTEAAVREALAELTGTISMRPPIHSAVSVGGKRLYELARAGVEVEAPERTVEISELSLLQFVPDEQARVLVDVTCSKGTYIRSLALMLGDRLGCGGYLSMLIRTRVGVHRLADATSLEELAQDPSGSLLTARQAIPHVPETTVDTLGQDDLLHGRPASQNASLTPGPVLVYNADDVLLCLAEVPADEPQVLLPKKVFV